MRRALAWLGVLLSAALHGAHAAPPSLPDLEFDNPAPGVYVHYGRQEEPSRANAGDIANFGFVVGTRCVAVIDTGGTYAVGRALREAIRRVTPLPVCDVVNTHGHPDHVFGNAAFTDDHPQFVGHARLPDALRRRGPAYLHALRRDLGDVADGTELVLPTRTIDTTDRIDLGERVLTLRAWPTAHTDADLTVLDETTRTLWLGDLLFVGHVPVVDGSLRGFVAVVGELSAMPADIAIPGHGRASGWPQAIAPERQYLEALLRDVRAAIKGGRTLADTVDAVGGARSQWLLFDDFHRRNVTAAYAELEWDE
jgi:quinoprotein relay system zinc metallohydrolase 2